MKATYKPRPCRESEGTKPEYTGDVVLLFPTYDERMEFIIDHPEVEDFDKEPDETDKELKLIRMKFMLEAVKWSYKYYEKVDIVRVRDKKQYKSLDDLKYDPSAQIILIDIATALQGDFSQGN